MKKINFTLFIILIILNPSCSDRNKNEYNLNGFVKNISNDTWIYLLEDGESKDSVKIINEKFSFHGIIEEPANFDLLIKETMDYKSIWLEKGDITFESEKGGFKRAKIIGSKSQVESEKLWKPIWAYRKKRDSLSKLVSNKDINDSINKIAALELESVNNNRLKIETDFTKNNPNSYVSAATLDFYAKTFGKSKTRELFDGFSDELKNSSYGKSIKRFLELNAEVEIGDKYVNFEMANQKGQKIQLSDFNGKFILLDFWASWCGPCIEEYPALRNAYSKYKNKGFEIVSISEDQSKERWIKAIESENMNWINLWEEDGDKSNPYLIYGINGIPDNFLISPNGIIVARNLRGDKLIKKLDEVFENKASL